jgi:signal peptidase I
METLPNPEIPPTPTTPRWKSEAKEWTKTILLTVVLSLGLRVAVVEAFLVPTGSMRPTILEGDRLLGSKFHYWFWQPHRGDVVVFKPPEEAQRLSHQRAPRYVKRVIAVEGDVVEIGRGVVKVNGQVVEEPYVAAAPDYRMPATKVPEGQLFVLGDNRNESLDSHIWGFLEKNALIAHVFVRYWPPNRIGAL